MKRKDIRDVPSEPEAAFPKSIFDDPRTTTCKEYGREWVHLRTPCFYVHKQNGWWTVTDRTSDYPVTLPQKTKRGAINAFLRLNL